MPVTNCMVAGGPLQSTPGAGCLCIITLWACRHCPGCAARAASPASRFGRMAARSTNTAIRIGIPTKYKYGNARGWDTDRGITGGRGPTHMHVGITVRKPEERGGVNVVYVY